RGKRHLFLEERVIRRAKRHKNGSKNSERVEKVGRSTVNSYVAAMVHLWKQQSRAKVKGNPLGKSLRNLVAFLLSHYVLMRSESARMTELAGLHTLVLENEGYSAYRDVVMVMRQGKTNQVGHIEVDACMMSNYVKICPHGMLGFDCFWWWHVEGESFPDFTSSECWYPIELLNTGKDSTKPMSYKVYHDAITAILTHIGIHSKSKIHVGRGSGSRMADLGGSSESQIRRLGRWNN
ncbi:hypothetical protein PHMEG_00021252, partial [Phytophthora megakarya]